MHLHTGRARNRHRRESSDVDMCPMAPKLGQSLYTHQGTQGKNCSHHRPNWGLDDPSPRLGDPNGSPSTSPIRSMLKKHTQEAYNMLTQWRFTSRVEMVSMWPLPLIHGPINWRRRTPPWQNFVRKTVWTIDLCTDSRCLSDMPRWHRVTHPHQPTCGSGPHQTTLDTFPPTLGRSLCHSMARW